MAIDLGMIVSRMRPMTSARGAAVGVAVTIFVLLCVLPVAWMVAVSFVDTTGALTLGNYRRLLSEPRLRELLPNSALLGTGAALLSTLIGAPLGLLLARAALPMKRLLRLALIVPLLIPPYVLALAWVYIGGAAGVVAQTFGRDLLSGLTYSLTGTVIVLGVCFFPLPMLATEAAARRVDGRLEEAALLAAGPGRVLRLITLPLIAPAVGASALLVFILSVSEFGAPGLLRVRVFTTEIFTAFSALYDFGAATALAVPLLALVILAAVAVIKITGERPLVGRNGARPGLILMPYEWRALSLVVVLLVVTIFVALPLAVLAAEAGRFEGVAAALGESRGAITNSLMISTAAATLIVALAVFLGYARARAGARMRLLADLSFILVFAAPSTVVGVGLIGLWNRPGLPGEIYASPAIIVIACLARFVPVAALMLSTGVRQIPFSWEEAAGVAGVSWPRTFVRIVLPNLFTTAVMAWVAVFILSFGELGATALVAPPGESTLPLRIYTLIANVPSRTGAALALAQAVLSLLPLALLAAGVKEGRRVGAREERAHNK
jgi:iron(III) transport system permease protein